MSVVYCQLLAYRGNSKLTVKKYSQQDVYLVKCSTPADGKTVAITGPGISVGQLLAGQVFVYCESIEAVPEAGSSTVFFVTVSWGTPKSNRKHAPNPLSVPPNVTFGGSAVREQVYFDIKGKAIANSAGVLYDPGLQRIFFDESISVEVNQASVDTALLATYRGAINSDTITMNLPDGTQRVFDPFTMRLAEAQTEWTYQNGVGFWKSKYDLAVRSRNSGGTPINWNPQVVDRGTEHINAAGNLVHNVSASGSRIQTPQLLNGSGALLPNPTTANAVLLTFDIDSQLPFASILTF